jgi:hypothetical protein
MNIIFYRLINTIRTKEVQRNNNNNEYNIFAALLTLLI